MDEQKEIVGQLKLQVKLLTAILALVFVCAAAIGIQSVRMWQVLSSVDAKAVSSAVTSLEKSASELEKIDFEAMNAGIQSFSSMAERMGKLDVESLNESFGAMATAVENLQKLDAEHLNGLIESLQKTAGTFDRFTGFFSK